MIQGSLVALVTPMKSDGSVDYGTLAKLVEFHVESGTDGIVAVGTTGESATLTPAEHSDVIGAVIKQVAGRIPVIAGTGSNSTQEAIELSQHAADMGADACLQVTPYYNKPTQHGLVAHFRAIAEAVPIAHILYNVPGRTAVDMQAETVAQLAPIENIIGIKEATGKVERTRQIIELCGPEFAVYSGDDAVNIDIIEAGGKGTVSVTANVAPKQMHQALALALEGDFVQAREVDKGLALLHQRLFVEANPIPVKWALVEMGLIPSGIRLPLTELSEKYHASVREALSCAGLI
ncbi:MAG: 4-hydroxy-tetrahydrodipicolinate synthase [Gammaproteobacteria bacterium]|nr:4-hydroxy-tetrahydrodipicolinate synthase [Gammaproteobacteria bacterium]MDH5693544.1 4-hydroxy-tetrahydrodipicolinate synthase [Gammaproteobacteria bacterium]